jgi:hypothetical protein
VLPNENPSSDIAISGPARLPHASAKTTNAASTTVVETINSPCADIRFRIRGLTRPATNPSTENGTRNNPAANVLSPNPYPAECGVWK